VKKPNANARKQVLGYRGCGWREMELKELRVVEEYFIFEIEIDHALKQA